MANRVDSSSLPPLVRRVSGALRIVGWVSFWGQLVLAIVSTVVLLFAAGNLNAPVPTANGTAAAPNPGAGAGLLFAALGLVILYVGTYWAFSYTRLSRRLKTPNAQVRPKRTETIRSLQIGLGINLTGMLLTILGAQAIVGTLVAKSLAQGFAFFSAGGLQQFVRPIDVFIVQGNTNTLMAHFIGIAASLLLLRYMNRQ